MLCSGPGNGPSRYELEGPRGLDFLRRFRLGVPLPAPAVAARAVHEVHVTGMPCGSAVPITRHTPPGHVVTSTGVSGPGLASSSVT